MSSSRSKANDILANCGEAVRRLNPDVFSVGGLGSAQHGKQARTLGGCSSSKPVSVRSVSPGAEITVTLTAHVWKRIDPDNLGHAFKPLQDEIAHWLGLDDGDPRIRWEYCQAETRAPQGVLVRITVNQPDK